MIPATTQGATTLRYTVEPLDEGIRAAYARLLPEQDALVQRGKLEWKYRHNPCREGMLAIARDEGRIMGMIGFVPARLRLAGHLVDAVQALDTVVDPATRGKGAFVRMGRELYRSAADLGLGGVYGFPNENAAPGWFGKLAWRRLGAPPFLVKPLSAGYFLRRLGLPSVRVPLAFPARAKHGIRPVDRFDERFDLLWDAFAGPRTCGVQRDHAYLNWRLRDCPTAVYRTLARYDGERVRSFVSTHVTHKHGGHIAYVMEAIGDDTLGGLLDHSMALLKEEGVEVVLAWGYPWSPNRRAFGRAGFLPLPERLRPVALHFGVHPLHPGASAMTLQQAWYLSYLDSDTV